MLPQNCFIILLTFIALLSNSLSLLQVQTASSNRVEILKVHESQENSPEYTVSGRLMVANGGRAQTVEVHLAIRKAGDAAWFIQPQLLRVEIGASSRSLNWSIGGVRFGRRSDTGERFEVVAFLVPDKTPTRIGVTHYQNFAGVSLVVSAPFKVERGVPEDKPQEPEPRVFISRIGKHVVDKTRTEPYPVGLEEFLRGEVRKPKDSYVQLVVQPLEGDTRWVMHGGHVGNTTTWDGNAFFGREGLDEWDIFLVYAVVTKHRIPADRIEPDQWDSYKKDDILAISRQVKVVRIELPFDPKTQTRIDITQINDRQVDYLAEWTATRLSTIEGRITGRTLSAKEKVWVFVKINGEDETWRNIGQAISNDERSWELPPVFVGNPGQRLKMVAVLAQKKINDIDDEAEKRFILAQSKPVKVLIGDESPLEITRINRQSVTENAEMVVPRLSSIAGTLANRPTSKDERVWIYVRSATGEGAWTLLGIAARRSGQSWELPPVVLGQSGQQLLMIAVLSAVRNDNLDDPNIKASPHIRVRVE